MLSAAMTSTNPDVTLNMRVLPRFRRLAMWQPDSGLIVSPYTRLLPSRVTWDMEDKRIETLSNPRLLQDKHIYLAFYPRKNWLRGALFSPLAHPNLSSLIVETSSNPPAFILSDDVCQAWIDLESFLLNISLYLFSEHRDRQCLPDIAYPSWPSQCGYKTAHFSKPAAFEGIKRSLHAFRMLSAFVSFTLSLWIGEIEDMCFDRPFEKLLGRTDNPIRPIQLDYLRDSVVCTILPGLRPGGFLNPYETKWGRAMYRICRFCVPLWMIWGHEQQYKRIRPADREIKGVFFPPEDVIKRVKERHATFASLILPECKDFLEARTDLMLASSLRRSTSTLATNADSTDLALASPLRRSTSTFATNADGTDLTLASPLRRSTSTLATNADTMLWGTDTADISTLVYRVLLLDRYRSATLQGKQGGSFRARMEKGLQKRKDVESERERQSREGLEANARKGGYSKKTTVFVWEEDEATPGLYRRTKVDKVHALQ